MASLDQMEGDTIELGLFLLVVVIVIAVWLAWKGLKNPLKSSLHPLNSLVAWLEKIAQALLDWIKHLLQQLEGLKSTGAGAGSFNPSATGSQGDITVTGADLSNLSIPLEAFNWGPYSPSDFLVTQNAPGTGTGGGSGVAGLWDSQGNPINWEGS